ncbi:hypothetical protein CF394_04290 [Tetzosporium hominis]|uniref:Type I restriction modification DNA specificity domain-containing protein n=1 Tax=Tetzosporium hominis TaxID=2020506 RepID=A0A264W5C1_9BACL|nr:restriction endonuclease subunit S [Tetzosporium hominis]OZS78764.1 hypothetical protein CF394_04290 [Tetzosporium hominis]
MNAQDLKNSILQFAIQGKLVEQREEEGTAKELLQQIEAAKEQLIKDKKIKKQKPLPEISADEIPFEIPESWEWVRLGNLFELTMGQSPKGNSVLKDQSGLEFHQGKVFFGNDYLQISDQTTNKPTKTVEPGTVLLCVRAPVGIVNITERKICIGRGLCGINTLASMDSKLVLYILRAFKNDFIKKATGSTFVAITGEVVKNQLIPLPPLQEQSRILAKIEELMPYVDKYGKAYSEVVKLNKKFPEDMQKSILQYAIQGKLVEQRAEEGTAEELYKKIQDEKKKLIEEGRIKKTKVLSEITEDEIPFEIPESWKWVRFGDVMINRDSERIPLSVSQREKLDKIYDYYGASGVIDKVDNYIFDEKLMLIGEDGANLLTRSKPIAFIANGKYWVNNHAHVIGCGDYVLLEYVMYYINAISLAKYVTGTAQPKMNQAKLNSIPVPLAPLEEQKRIVNKIEVLLPYTKQLIKF